MTLESLESQMTSRLGEDPLNIVVVLPAYNEAHTIVDTIEDFNRELPDAKIWVINNCSTDDTAKLAMDAIANLDCGGGVINEWRPGKGSALRRGFLEIQADVYVLADADLTYPASDIHDMLKHVVMGEADMVVGDRHSMGAYDRENKRALHGLGNRLVCFLVNRLFHSKLADIMSGYRVFSRRFVMNYPVLADGFEVETDMTLHALDKRFRIVEVPVGYRDRPSGSSSKLNTLRDGTRVLKSIWNILRYYRPLFFFGSVAALFSLLGLIVAIPVFQDWVSTRYVYHVPLAILATGLELVSIVLMAVGLILDSIVHQDKRNFMRNLIGR